MRQNKRPLEDHYKVFIELTSALNQKVSLDPELTEMQNGIILKMRIVHGYTCSAFIDGLDFLYNNNVKATNPITIVITRKTAECTFNSTKDTNNSGIFKHEYSS